MKKEENYLTNKEAIKELKVQACELMHLRTSGKLDFEKKGNAFLYSEKSFKGKESLKKDRFKF